MLGYILWTTDQLAAHSRHQKPHLAIPAGASLAPAAPAASHQRTADCGAARAQPAGGAAAALLAPRFAACYKIAMSVAMGYMLITML